MSEAVTTPQLSEYGEKFMKDEIERRTKPTNAKLALQSYDEKFEGMKSKSTPLTRLLDAGSKVLQEKISESYEPEWQEIIRKMFIAMRKQEAAEFLK